MGKGVGKAVVRCALLVDGMWMGLGPAVKVPGQVGEEGRSSCG